MLNEQDSNVYKILQNWKVKAAAKKHIRKILASYIYHLI